MTANERRGLFYGAFAVLFFSTAPVLIRWGEPLSPYVITWGRVLLGHTLYNAALRRTRATYVNLIATQKVASSIILGYLFLSEVLSFNSLLGAAIPWLASPWS
jgi:drug/metabolite transporter (DMT)-like permease